MDQGPALQPARIDHPWLYTALWSNFDEVYTAFRGTYYVSRVPWIVPGLVLHDVFDARTASLVLHTGFFLGGGVLFYVLCRRWLGVLAGAVGYLGLIGCQMYFNAHRWDYQEGAVLTYMIAAFAFSLPRTNAPRVRAASMVLGGFFAAAMVTTRIIDVAYLIGLPLLYVAVAVALPPPIACGGLSDVTAFAAGALVLVLWAASLRGLRRGISLLHPQVRVVRSTSGGYNRLPAAQWLPGAPYFWVVPFVVLFAVVVLAVARTDDRLARRVLLASALWLALVFVSFAFWQFLGDGWLFNIDYYFSSFLVPTMFCLSATVAVVIGSPPLSRRCVVFLVACAVAILVG